MAANKLSIGSLCIPYQILDVAGPLDILSSCSKNLAQPFEDMGLLPAGTTAAAPDIEFHHIGETMDPVAGTAGMTIIPTTTIDNCPELDYLLIGGPDPATFQLSPAYAAFLQKHVAAGKGIFTTCTGGLAISASGVLDGRVATTNHSALSLAEKLRPAVKWARVQWVEDGNIWTAGGAAAGMDMMAHFVREKYGQKILDLALVALDFEPRDREGKRALKAESA
ncbi:hypothetical protein BP6252_05829 [Coleophoma cylindrospora]|uniref:DJ-1/PfpI domain-containing protein n=1 Tax=Coleophoma cylindrospora TaxID=1849047 RepID=A0A3D8RUX4_9HELO|nr:hypothetical protein BP6252_05829 [Coleophoma cylindrospora]